MFYSANLFKTHFLKLHQISDFIRFLTLDRIEYLLNWGKCWVTWVNLVLSIMYQSSFFPVCSCPCEWGETVFHSFINSYSFIEKRSSLPISIIGNAILNNNYLLITLGTNFTILTKYDSCCYCFCSLL